MSEQIDDGDRRTLAQRQRRLVAALCAAAAAEPPDGIDPGQLTRAAASLHAKRARGVAKTWPVLERGLGEQFDLLFAGYAQGNVLPAGGTAQDAPAFAGWLARVGMLDDAGRVQLMIHRARRGWPIRLARLRRNDRIAVAARLPWLGIRWFSFPIGAAAAAATAARTPMRRDGRTTRPESASGPSG